MPKNLATGPQRGDRVTAAAEELVAGGEALCRIDGLPLFVPGLYPGDEAIVEITERKPRFARARVVERLRDSPDRRLLPCPVAEECGGCDWTGLRLDAQLRAKRRILLESLRRIGRFDTRRLPSVQLHPSPLQYRLRSRLHYDSERDALGFFASKSHRVVPLPVECEVVGPRAIAALPRLARLAVESNSSGIRTFETIEGLVAEPADSPGVPVSISVGAFHYRLSTSSFFQVNRHVLELLIERVIATARRVTEPRTALDLYSGAGFFAAPLTSLFPRVIAVESSKESAFWARENTSGMGGVEIIPSSVEDYLASANVRAEFVFADPPRAGMEPSVVEHLDRIDPEIICSLSCDPVTFSRDASRLARRGWSIHTLDLIDLFPNTHHIETLSSFVRER